LAVGSRLLIDPGLKSQERKAVTFTHPSRIVCFNLGAKSLS